LIIDNEACGICEKCIDLCPLNIIKRNVFSVVILEGCNNCGKCLEICPCGAIHKEA
jgi:flavoprotein